jgi:type VI secretion system VgrG family protein
MDTSAGVAMTTQNPTRYTAVFRSAALAPNDLFVRQLDGHEGLSQLFAFDVIVETTSGAPLAFDAIDEMLRNSAYIAFGDDEEYKIHGVVREVEMLSMSEPTPVLYHLRVVPRLFDTTLTAGSWVYLDLSAPQILKDVLNEAGLHEGTDYELRLSKKYTPYEYKVQYEETDFQFLSRVMEYEGIFYFFEHTEEGAKVVFVDGNNTFPALEGFESLAYDPRGNTDGPEARITALSRTRRTVTGKVTLRDYNYRTPSVQLAANQAVDAAGVGEHVYYGEHFKDFAGGNRVAKLRAQELFAQRETYAGATSVRGLRAGHKFAVEGHFVAAMEQEYVVTDVRHSVQQEGITGAGGRSAGYHNEFSAIPYEVPWRPVRVTPVPRIPGVVHGKVDAPADGVRATPVDEHGRYKVILPWDLAGAPGGKASRWLRMAQPASGGGYGVQFPLHVGTEVLLVHVNGDPDRPLILSSVPNHETSSPVTSANATQSQIRTRHGITVTFDDHS